MHMLSARRHMNVVFSIAGSDQWLKHQHRVDKVAWAEEFHVYSLVWTETRLEVFVDGFSIFKVDQRELLEADPQNPFGGSLL